MTTFQHVSGCIRPSIYIDGELVVGLCVARGSMVLWKRKSGRSRFFILDRVVLGNNEVYEITRCHFSMYKRIVCTLVSLSGSNSQINNETYPRAAQIMGDRLVGFAK